MNIELSPTKDILYHLGKEKKANQKLIGFALESTNLIEYGTRKLEEKNCDFIIVNQANAPDSGFNSDNNTIAIIDRNKSFNEYPAMSKEECAKVIFSKILS